MSGQSAAYIKDEMGYNPHRTQKFNEILNWKEDLEVIYV